MPWLINMTFQVIMVFLCAIMQVIRCKHNGIFLKKKWHPFKTDIQLNDNCFIKILQYFLLFNFQIKVYKYSMSKNSWAQTNNEDLDQMLLLKSTIW